MAQLLRALSAPRGPKFESQHQMTAHKLSATPIPGDLMPSSGFLRDQAQT
ncbi:Uncharacterised protein [Chlamydia trachomatis]|nr:Uncharacterised protein [Chlamydia trachomatis]